MQARIIILGFFLQIAAIVGDLLASVFKRAAGVKDSGTFFPGHGGLLDRMDSFLVAGPIFLYVWMRSGGWFVAAAVAANGD